MGHTQECPKQRRIGVNSESHLLDFYIMRLKCSSMLFEMQESEVGIQ